MVNYRPREGDECFLCPSCIGGTQIIGYAVVDAVEFCEVQCDMCGCFFLVDYHTISEAD